MKLVHTVVWAAFAGCIVAIPIVAWEGRLRSAVVLIGIVFVEVVVLAANSWRCPLTLLASHYTADRGDNFDIYLPIWLARYNKVIFGMLFVFGVLSTAARWRWAR